MDHFAIAYTIFDRIQRDYCPLSQAVRREHIALEFHLQLLKLDNANCRSIIDLDETTMVQSAHLIQVDMAKDRTRSKTFPFLSLRVPAGEIGPVTAALWESDMLGLEETEADEGSTILKVYFERAAASRACRNLVEESFPVVTVVESGTVDYNDWVSFLHGGFEPLDVGPLFIVPAEEPPPIPADKKPLYINPGRGFGTGSHPSTRLCLRLLVDAVEPGIKVLDVGTGSGILAIAACLLGASSVVAVDIDEDALENARENAGRNGVEGKISFMRGSIQAVESGGFDLILANIITPVLVKLLGGGLADLLAPGGRMILSGITADSSERLTGTMKKAHLSEETRLSEKEWLALMLKKLR